MKRLSLLETLGTIFAVALILSGALLLFLPQGSKNTSRQGGPSGNGLGNGCDLALVSSCSGSSSGGANYTDANLDGANFQHTDLSYANFENASLAGADFTGANLQNADLRGANVTGANLSNAFLCNTIMPSGYIDNADCTG